MADVEIRTPSYSFYGANQEAISSFRPEVLNIGPAECLAGEARVYTAQGYVAIETLHRQGKAVDVLTTEGFSRATAPFIKGRARLYRVTVESGHSFVATEGHRVLTEHGWKLVGELTDELLPVSVPSRQWSKVSSVRFEREDLYYDLTVPGAAHYLADGFWHHNTGKTLSWLWKLHAVAYDHKDASIVILRKTLASTYGTVLSTYIEKIIGEDDQIRIYGGTRPSLFIYPTGSHVTAAGMDKSTRILSAEHDLIFANQVEELLLDDWEVLTTRTTGRAGHIPFPQVIGDANPSFPQHWMYTRKGVDRYFSWHKDNPSLWDYTKDDWTPQGHRSIEQLSRLTGVRRARLYEGRAAQAEGVVFEEWNEAIHHIYESDVPALYRFVAGVDWGFCYSMDTDVLTKRGWLKHPEITSEDIVACFDTEGNKLVWEKPLGFWEQDYAGEMIEVVGESTNFMVSPEHSVWISQTNGCTPLPYGQAKAKDLLSLKNRQFRVRLAARSEDTEGPNSFDVPYYYCKRRDRQDKDTTVSMSDWLRFLGWFISEGSAQLDYWHSVEITQLAGEHADQIDAMISKLPYNVYRKEFVNQWGKDQVVWRIACKSLCLWLREHCGAGSKNKKIPAFVFDCSTTDIQLFLETLLLGDGGNLNNSKSPVYWSSSKKLLDQVQALALSLGYASTKSFYGAQGMGRVSLMEKQELNVRRDRHVKKVSYSGKIYCLKTRTGFYVTRRQGKVAFQGNTNPGTIQVWGIDGRNGNMYLVEQYYHRKKLDDWWLERALELEQRHKEQHWPIEAWVCDPSEPAYIAKFMNAGLNAFGGYNKVSPGISAVNQRLRNSAQGEGKGLYVVRDSLLLKDDELEADHLPTDLAGEITGYVWADVRAKEVPIKVNDHGCFIAGTKILTNKGPVAIEDIRPGDLVLTRDGYHLVEQSGVTGYFEQVRQVVLSDGRTLTGTKNHPIWVQGRGYIELRALRYGDIIVESNYYQRRALCQLWKSLFIRESSLGVIPLLITTQIKSIIRRGFHIAWKAYCGCTGRYGAMRTALFPMATVSTIGIVTQATIRSATWSVFQKRSTQSFTKIYLRNEGRNAERTFWKTLFQRRQSGTNRQKGEHGTLESQSEHGSISQCAPMYVNTAGALIIPKLFSRICAFVQTSVNRLRAGQAEWTTSKGTVPFVDKCSQLIATLRQRLAPVRVLANGENTTPAAVYNLAVEGAHEYFANGILVHNCDSMRYVVCYVDNITEQAEQWIESLV